MSRTANSLRNIKIALFSQFIGILLGFISRKIFIVFLSSEYLGLSGLFSNILTMLSLAELGVGGAIVFSLYRPIAENNTEEIKSLMLLYKRAYLIIGSIILIVGAALTPFLEFFISEMPDIPLLRLFYVLYVADTGISYFFAYKQSLIIANQQRYIVDLYSRVFKILLDLAQIAALILTQSFLLYLCLAIAKAILCNIFLSRKADRMFPFLKDRQASPIPKETVKTIKNNVFALICHRVGGIVVSGTDNLLIARMVGLVEVGVYSNYTLISSAVNSVIGLLFQSVTASLGNLNVEASEMQKAEFFNRLSFVGAWIYGFCACCLWALLNPFIELWIGTEYTFGLSVVFWIALNFYVMGMRVAVATMRNVAGLFWNDRFSPLCEAVINLAVSIILGLRLGVTGILIGTFISAMSTRFWTEPFVVYRNCLRRPLRGYFIRYGIYTAVAILAASLTSFSCGLIPIAGVASLIIKMAICAVMPNAIFILAYHRTDDFRYFLRLFTKIIRERKG